MESLHLKEPDRLHVSGELSEEQQLIEKQHCLIMLNTIFGAEVVAKYLEKERGSYLPLFRSLSDYSNLVEKQNKLETD